MALKGDLRQDQLALPDHAKTILGMITMEAQLAISQGKERPIVIHVISPDHVSVFGVNSDDELEQEEKDAFVGLVRQEAAKSNADLVVMLSEGWRPAKKATTLEEAEAIRKESQRNGGLANSPDAIEVLIVYLESPTHAFMATADITGQGITRRHAELRYTVVPKESQQFALLDIATFSRLLPSAERKAEVKACLDKAAKLYTARGLDPHAKIGHLSAMESLEKMMWQTTDGVLDDTRLAISAELLAAVQRAMHDDTH